MAARWSALSPIARAAFCGAAALLAVIGTVWLLSTTHRVLMWVLIAFVLALALDHPVALLERAISRTLASIVAFAAAVVVALGVGYLLVVVAVDQIGQLIENLPQTVERLSRGEGPLGFLQEQFDIVQRAEDFSEQADLGSALGAGGPILTVATNAVTLIIAVISIAFMTLFMLVYGPRIKDSVLRSLPPDERDLGDRISGAVRRSAGGWVVGAGIVAVPATLSAYVVLEIVGAPYPVALAAIVMVVNPLPFIGTATASLVVGAVLLAEEGPTAALVFVGFMIAYNQLVENHLLVPMVYGNTVRLSPLAVLVVILIGGEIASVPGALLAIPLSGAVKAAFDEVRGWRGERQTGAVTADEADSARAIAQAGESR